MSLNKLKNYQEENFVIKNIPKHEPIYIMTLELEKGNPEKIEIYPDSNPEYLATYFCKKHNLDYNGLDYLKQKIRNVLKLNIKENKTSNNNYNNDIQNKENIVNNSTKRNNNKSKPRINNNIKEKQYKNIKTENKYNNRIKKKIKLIENINKINNKKNTISNNNNKNNIKKYNSFKDKEDKKNEKELFDTKPEIKKSPSKSIKNKRNNKFQKIYNSKIYDNKTKDNICSKILNIYENKFSFHPTINQNYKTDLTFAERQTFYKNLYIKRKKELNKFYSNKKKDVNGQLFFKPN